MVHRAPNVRQGLHGRAKRRLRGAGPLGHNPHFSVLSRVQGNDPGAIPVAASMEYDGLSGDNHAENYAFPVRPSGSEWSCRFRQAPYICSLFRSSSAG